MTSITYNFLALLTSIYGLAREFMPNVINEHLRLDAQKKARPL
jgi:hypothetical protein